MKKLKYPELLPEDQHLGPYLPPYSGKIDTSDSNYMSLYDKREKNRELALKALKRAKKFKNINKLL